VVPKPLVRRIPGTQRPPATGAAEPAPRVPADPDAARAEIEAFEAGVARAALYEQRTERQ
jgi:hypothetical protein